jgi:hypothetical protein
MQRRRWGATLRSMVERILHDPVSYVSHGRLIWAAALGLTLSVRELDSPNIKIGLPPLE